jgi:hypothetical protein
MFNKSKFRQIYLPESEKCSNYTIEKLLQKIGGKATKLRNRTFKLSRGFSQKQPIWHLENERVRSLIINSSFMNPSKFNIKQHENRKAKLSQLLSKNDLAKMRSKIWRDYLMRKPQHNSTFV